MADHSASSGNHSLGIDAHAATYAGFIKGSVALSILCFYVLVALVAFAFVSNYNVLLGFGGLVIGIVALLIDARASNSWYVSGAWLAVFGLITAISVG
jgi:hypothetical protein